MEHGGIMRKHRHEPLLFAFSLVFVPLVARQFNFAALRYSPSGLFSAGDIATWAGWFALLLTQFATFVYSVASMAHNLQEGSGKKEIDLCDARAIDFEVWQSTTQNVLLSLVTLVASLVYSAGSVFSALEE